MRSALVLCMVALFVVPVSSSADISPWISYQGVLRDGSGSVVPDDDYLVTFTIYDDQTGANALWVEQQSVSTDGGVFNVYLGSTTPLNTLAFDVPYWLGISVEGQAELDPRTPFTTVPYAGHAGYADTCLEGDDDWHIDGDDVYNDLGDVGIGTQPLEGRLDVLAGDEKCARFQNASGGVGFTVTGVNNSGTAGGFFSTASPAAFPATPAAVFGVGGGTSRGGHFQSDSGDALFAAAPNGRALWGYSTGDYAGYFSGGGMGVYVDDLLQTSGFRMTTGMSYGYVLTCDGSGYGTWQPSAAVSDGDWTVAGSDIYSAVSGRVGVGLSLPTAKFEVYNDTAEEAMEVKHGTASISRLANLEYTAAPATGSDVLQLVAPAGSADEFQFIECERGVDVEFAVDGDGFVLSEGGAWFKGDVAVDAEMDVTTTGIRAVEAEASFNSDQTRALSGVVTATGTGAQPIGVYGESVPSDTYGIGGYFVGGGYGLKASVSPTGSNTYVAVHGQVVGSGGSNYAVYGSALGSGTNYGVYGTVSGTGYAGYFQGDVQVTGTLYGGSKSFKIDHPLDPSGQYLVHTSVESDEMVNVYSGNVALDGRGEGVVELPDWFEAVNRDFRYQLTAVGAPGPGLYIAEEISGGTFRIAGGVPGSKVSWQVTGVRHDPFSEANRTSVEQPKPADEAGTYMHPEVYGMPETARVGYREERESEVGSTAAAVPARELRDRGDGDS